VSEKAVTFDPNVFVAKWYCGYVLPEEMPGFAADALEAGFDGHALRQLAGLVKPTSRDVGDLFVRALDDMGVAKPSTTQQAIFKLSKEVAKAIIDGSVDPFKGAQILSRYALTAGYPEGLAQFYQLADEPFWGEYARSPELIRAEIVAEATKLLAISPE
jgi:hypothetical protein